MSWEIHLSQSLSVIDNRTQSLLYRKVSIIHTVWIDHLLLAAGSVI